MRLLFPSDPVKPSRVDLDFDVELKAASAVGFDTSLFSLEAIEAGDPDASLEMMPPPAAPGEPVLHRGWMVAAETYRLLCEGLEERGFSPVTPVEAYEESHYLPLAIRNFEADTARSDWIEGDDVEDAWKLYQRFAGRDAIIKDWVKSAKHRWREACFIPAETSRARFGEIFRNFRRERGEKFNRGVVIREHHPLESRGSDIRGFPIVEEYRLFFWRNTLVALPDSDGRESPLAESERWEAIAGKFRNPFLTIDVARRQEGGWLIIEVGDGGVSGLPLAIDPMRFYASLRNQIDATNS